MMKPFDPTKPAQTRDGRPVRIICTDKRSVSDHCLVVLIPQKRNPNEEMVFCLDRQGRYSVMDSDYDLENVPEKTHKYQNVHADGHLGIPYPSKEKADIFGNVPPTKRIGYIRHNYVEGEYVGCDFFREE